MRNFIGFDSLRHSFSMRCLNKNLSHAHLIVGEDGIGKSILANNFAKLILGHYEERDYIDIINYKCDKASFGVDDVRNIIEEVQKRPYEGDKKVIIVHQGNKLTTQAQNALLKTMEEPPYGVYIIILCESLELILDTIKSRCEIYKLSPLSKDELIQYIKVKGFERDTAEIVSAIAFSEGIPGRIDRYFEDETLKEIRNEIVDVLIALNKGDVEVILKHEEKLLSYKTDKEEILKIIGSFIRDIMVNKEIENEDFIINGDKILEIRELTRGMSFRKLDNIMIKIAEARKNIKSNVNWAMTLRVMLMGFMEV